MNKILSIITASWLLLSYSLFFVVANDKKLFLTKEDGLVETAGAIFWLLSAILIFTILLKNRRNANLLKYRNIIFLFLAFAFLFAFLEEISWGQRIFNITTPQFVQEINAQGETTIHNLYIFQDVTMDGEIKIHRTSPITIKKTFRYFWFIYCCLFPLLYKFFRQIKKNPDRIDFPIVPIFIGAFFILNYLLKKMMIASLDLNGLLLNSIDEINESNLAFLFFIVSIWFFKNKNMDHHNNVI